MSLNNGDFNGFDGELVLNNTDEFNSVLSAVMTEDGRPDFIFQVFDDFTCPDQGFLERYESLINRFGPISRLYEYVKLLKQSTCSSPEDVWGTYLDFVEEGGEGIILRSPTAPYKSGRSTKREQFLLKMKPLADSEAIIIGFKALKSNQNEAEEDLFGLTKRSSHKANMVEQDTLGAFVVKHPEFGEFQIGMGKGLTQKLRKWIWDNRDKLLGEEMTFSYQDVGKKDKPRFPKFMRLRNIVVMP